MEDKKNVIYLVIAATPKVKTKHLVRPLLAHYGMSHESRW